MTLLEYIFFLGIVMIIFSMIWGFFMLIYRILSGLAERPAIERYLVKGLNMYILVSLCAMKTVAYFSIPGTPDVLLTIAGLLVLYVYLTGRMERQRFNIQFNAKSIQTEKLDMRWESVIVVASLVFFSFAIRYPQLAENSMNLWFYTAIEDIYNTAVIGWIFGFIGFFFLLMMIFRSIFISAKFINELIDYLSGNNRNKGDKNKKDGDDGYSDYEIIE
jgi:hypothetical protein